jgi:8-amino-7-oxononanoate synthase
MSLFHQLHSAPSRLIRTADQQYLYFGGTSYLGIAQDREFKELFLEGIDQYGLNTGTSRRNNVQLDIFSMAEQEAARRFGSPSALMVSSGFLAAQLVVRALSGYGQFIYAPDSHPALWLAGKPESSGTFRKWIENTLRYINESSEKCFVLVSDSLNTLRPERYDFSAFTGLDSSKEIILLVDDSHGLGVIGEDGKGVYSSLPSDTHIRPLVVASMAKGLAVDGGLILADQEMINTLRQSPMFSGASPAAPAGLYAFVEAGEIYSRQWATLRRNMQFMETNLPQSIQYTKGFPAYLAENPDLYKRLLAKGIVISSFPYPQETDPLLNRMVVSSWHHQDDLQFLINQLTDEY